MTTTINTHGRNIVLADLEKASKYTRDKIDKSRAHYAVYYDVETGEVWADYVMNGSWQEFQNSEVICAMTSHGYINPQRIADAIDEAMYLYEVNKSLEAEGERIARAEGR